jgi:hypothetical protein
MREDGRSGVRPSSYEGQNVKRKFDTETGQAYKRDCQASIDIPAQAALDGGDA